MCSIFVHFPRFQQIQMCLMVRKCQERWLEMCEKAGISNYSLHAAGTTELFQSDIPEKVIQSRTGSLSLKALKMYEKISDDQQKAACKILTPIKNVLSSDVPAKDCIPTKSTTVSYPSTLGTIFGSAQNCSINIQVFNSTG